MATMDWGLLYFFVISAVLGWSEAWSNNPMFDFMSPFFNNNPMMPGPFSKLLKKVQQDTQSEPLGLHDSRLLPPDNLGGFKVRYFQDKKAQDPFSDLLFNFGEGSEEAKKNKKKPHDKVVMSFTELLLPFQNMENDIANSLLSPGFPFGDFDSEFKNKHSKKLKKHLKRIHGAHNGSMPFPHLCRLILNFKSENLSKEKANHNLGKAISLDGWGNDKIKVVNETEPLPKKSLFFVQKPSVNHDASFATIIYSQNKIAPSEDLLCVRTDLLKLLLPCLLGTLGLLLLGILILLKKKSKPDYYLKHVEEC